MPSRIFGCGFVTSRSDPLVGADEEQDAGVLAHDAGIDAVVIL